MKLEGGEKLLYACSALLPAGWAENVLVRIDDSGSIAEVVVDAVEIPIDAERVSGALIPGIGNCHSHAWQRVMVGLTEVHGGGDFWDWREVMYRFVQQISPEALHAIAAQAFVEMLKSGYTGVAEFHYLHHQKGGENYSNPAEMSEQVIEAARSAGIHITHLPVLYCHSDFGGKPPTAAQARFVHEPHAFVDLFEMLSRRYGDVPGVSLGVAPHSLRAVGESSLNEVLAAVSAHGEVPIHIHIAEQVREVEACVAWSKQRPVAWLMDRFDVRSNWCLIHATHIDDSEIEQLARSGAVVGLCPTTEANLGDGIFPATKFLSQQGRIAVGSDSQVSTSPIEELRLLEYGQRLVERKRTLLADLNRPNVGAFLYERASHGATQALGLKTGSIEVGFRADLVVLDVNDAILLGKSGDQLLDAWIFSSSARVVRDVMVAGCWQVRDGVHVREDEILAAFRNL